MLKASFFRIFLLIILVCLVQNVNSQIAGFNKIKWEKEKIAPGLKWKSSHTFSDDSTPQNINILIINLQKRAISLFYNPEKNIIVSNQAEMAGALAAVNAGFFNIKDGGSVTYIRSGGQIVDSDTAKKWTRNSNMTGSILINKSGHIAIEQAQPNIWYDRHTDFTEVLVTGPLLLSGGNKINLPFTPLVINRHPRTVIGKRNNHRIIMVTIDGRTDQAAGMAITEVTDFMLSLRCTDAVNLDGGGSTTMWISGQPFNGVVNMPCDNKQFDHAGERAVSDILIIK